MTTGAKIPAPWREEPRVFATAGELEDTVVQAAAEGAGILCTTGRLARRLLHRYRQARLVEQNSGWETPLIRSLRGWVHEVYDGLWLPNRPLAPAAALKLWHQALQGVAVPEGLAIQPTLYSQLQASLDVLREAGLEAPGTLNTHRLAEFRREVTGRFLALAERAGVALWHDMVSAVSQAITAGRVALPTRIILAGFDNLSLLEGTFGDALAAQRRCELWRSAAELPEAAPALAGALRVRLYATPEQECRAVCTEVLRAWNNGQKNLAVVFADRALFPLLKRCFDDLAGLERPDFERAVRYNLTAGTPLSEHKLFQTAIIPLRLPETPLCAPLLTALLTSPYVRSLESKDLDNLRATLWEEPSQPLSLPDALQILTKQGYPLAPLQRLTTRPTASLGDWLTNLNECLAALGFGRFEGQHRATDALAIQHLNEISRELTQEAGEIVMSAAAVLPWLTALAEKTIIAEKTPETAGIQVLNPEEARGLAFDQLWLIGVHGGALPPPAREWPFLDPDERRLLEDGTLERQWQRAQRQLAMLLAASPQVHCSRAAAGDEATPYAPCPLLPDETNSANEPIQVIYNLWQNPTAEWMRSRWLSAGCLALRGATTDDGRQPARHSPASPDEGGTTDNGSAGTDDGQRSRVTTPFPRELSVTALEDLVGCPFRFFCGNMLKLAPLVMAETGIAPLERGKVLHAILKTFADGLAKQAPGWPVDCQGARAWLEEVINRELAHCPDNLFWQVERLRLLGNAEQPGILPVWLELERQRCLAGWRFAMAEVSFTGLPVAGIILHGRIDRIDHHPQNGLAVWDYKSGAVPKLASVIGRAEELQLPAYLLALLHGCIAGIKDTTKSIQAGLPAVAAPQALQAGRPAVLRSALQAGYISLKTAADVDVLPLTSRGKAIDWTEILPQWENALAERLAEPRQGLFPADPRPGSPAIFHARNGACEFCEFFNLCGFYDYYPSADEAEDFNREME